MDHHHHHDVAGGGQIPAINGDDEQLQFDDQYQSQEERLGGGVGGFDTYDDNVDDSAGNEIKHSHSIHDDSNRDDSSAGKLFVGGIAWETTEESFSNYFSNYGEITDSVIMMDKLSGRPRGFGFVTFSDPAVADKVLEEEHVIDGRPVEVKRTVPREDMQARGVSRTKKIFVGGIPLTLTEDEFRDYFLSYGNVVEHQIMLDHNTGRPRGFGFVTFESEEAVEKIFSDGQIHELGGKQVEIKRAEPKRAGGDYSYDSRPRHSGGSSKSYGSFGRGSNAGYGGGYSAKPGRGYGAYAGGYPSYDTYGGNYGGGAAGFYAGYGGYGYGFGYGGPMYAGAGYGSGAYGAPGSYGGGAAAAAAAAAAGYGGGKGYGNGGGGSGAAGGGYGGRGFGRGGGGSGGYDGSKGYGSGGGASGGRFHPYRK